MGGGSETTTTQRNIPEQSALEAQLQGLLGNFGITGLNSASNFQNQANTAVGNTYNPNWSALSGNYNNTMSGVNSGYSSLANGQLPSEYAANRQQALNADLNSTVGKTLNSLGNKGILNSSVTRSAMNDISKNASNTLAANYSSDLGTQSNLLNSQANAASNTLAGNSSAQQGSYYQPNQLFNFASNSYSPASNLFNTMYSGRMNSAGTTQTSDGGGKGSGVLGTALGTVAGKLIK